MPKCLIVDDVEVTRFISTELLSDMGVSSDVAETSEDALNKLRAESFDMILLDWHIGKESGLDLLGIIRAELGAQIKVIVFSGVEDESKASEAISAGADDFVSKPTTQEKLEASFSKLGIAA